MTFAPLRFALFLAGIFVVLAGIILAPGSLKLTGHEGDTIHSLDIAYRLAAGARPHVDVMTPLGMLAFLPLQLFLERGFGPGMSFLMGQTAVALVLLPGIWWVGMSRLTGWLRLFYGAGMVILAMALIFGGENPALALSMYYNRWAWVLASFIILPVLLPARSGWEVPAVDGAVAGFAGAALLLIKITYVVALLPVVLVFLLRERQVGYLLGGLFAAFAVLAAATVYYGGFGFWQAYIGNLVSVASGPMRQHPGVELGDLIASPQYLPMSMTLLAAVVLWRKSGLERQGLYMLLLAPGFIYITFQNWGNDPKWLFFLGITLLACRPSEDAKPLMGMPPRIGATVLACFAFLLLFPSMSNLATSGMRNLSYDTENMTAIFPQEGRQDILISESRKFEGDIQVPFTAVGYPEGEVPEDAEPQTITVNGEEFPDCALKGSVIGWFWKAAEQLAEVEEVVGKQVYTADFHDSMWLFGPFEPTRGAGPWYYAADGDLAEAEYLMVPFCAISDYSRREKLKQVAEADRPLEEILRTDLFILLRWGAAG
ncbi:hypothetical protein ACW9UR_08565 [Halovulum sp. GXIMD14794]